ncbi:Proline-rich receptor-like kinase [Heracleum sosnowskyi]|uniref:Proline-rich receptor-like kinase n=1 Tax=Heracleum sosnowskyi TaxID=360622 RepID=A0AAD8I0V2_9APIA|nr:Proline-rich receptor-like kinase [Heracleum sosnowskyi]
MYRTRETNPHFLPFQPQNQPQPPESVTNPNPRILPLQPQNRRQPPESVTNPNPHTLPSQPQNQLQPPESVTNPHFLQLQPPHQQPQPPRSQLHPSLEVPAQPQAWPLSGPSIELAPQTRPKRQSKRSRAQHGAGLLSDPTRSHLDSDPHSPRHSQPRPQRQPRHPELLAGASRTPPVHVGHSAVPQQQQSSVQRIPPPRKTKPFTWCIAILCAIFWIIIILVGLIVLIIYLLYHPKSPKFDVAGATLNAAYLDMGFLLNADVTFLANFTNPNKKVNVNFKHIIINLYFDGIPIATRYIDHFHVRRAQYHLANVHMVTSQVRLSPVHSQKLKKQIESGKVKFDIQGLFKAKSKLGNVLKYSYSLYGHCSIVMTGPPNGVLVAKTCSAKR